MADENNNDEQPEVPNPPGEGKNTPPVGEVSAETGETPTAEATEGDEAPPEESGSEYSSSGGRKREINPELVTELADDVKSGDDALNKLRIQNIDFILDVPLKVGVELGRTKVLIKDLLQLGQGSVLELDKMAGEPLEILVNGKLIARGEVVVVNEKFGIRITDIISPVERIETLNK